jgi:hypothetical protein
MEATTDDPAPSLPIDELRKLLVRGGYFDGINLLVSSQDTWVQLHVMAVSMGKLGLLLASISDNAELDDRDSMSCRITPAGDQSPDRWQYELIASRYPVDRTIVFSAKIRLPASDLPEVVRRLRRHD